MRVYRSSDSKLHMCDHCGMSIPECPKATVIEFGDGVGNDNVVACSEFNGALLADIPISVDTSMGVIKSAAKN